jgi:hypothetical protein
VSTKVIASEDPMGVWPLIKRVSSKQSAPFRIGLKPISTRNGVEVKIRSGWMCAGRSGVALGPSITVNGNIWTPILWHGDEDPSWEKTLSLEYQDWNSL